MLAGSGSAPLPPTLVSRSRPSRIVRRPSRIARQPSRIAHDPRESLAYPRERLTDPRESLTTLANDSTTLGSGSMTLADGSPPTGPTTSGGQSSRLTASKGSGATRAIRSLHLAKLGHFEP